MKHLSTFAPLLRNWQPTLRTRLTLSMVALLVIYSLILVANLHVTGNIRVSNAPIMVVQPDGSLTEYYGVTYEGTINDVRYGALQALLVLTLFGGWGTYWLAGHMLRPLREFSATIERISAGSLGTRLTIPEGNTEFQSMTSSFNRMLARLEAAFAQQECFVADAAHELRTPLATLRTTLETQPPPIEMTPADHYELAQTFDRTLTRMETLVEHLLVLAVDNPPPASETIVLGALLEDIRHDLFALATTHQVSVDITGATDLVIVGEAPLIGLALANLIDNAIRYNRTGGRVLVQLAGTQNQTQIRVTDTGIGIPPADQSNIFDRFYRVDQSRSRHRGGAGLGLSLVAHIVQRHGGTIDLSSTPGQGSTFTVTLPGVVQDFGQHESMGTRQQPQAEAMG